MRTRLFSTFYLTVAVAVAVALPLAACSDLLGFKTLPTYRYQVTVEVNTPEGLRRGSSVIQVETHRGPGWAPDKYPASWNVSGDAVTVDLGQRGKLFMALRLGVSSESWAPEAMLSLIPPVDYRAAPEGDDRLIEIQHVLALKGWHCIKGCQGEAEYKTRRNGGMPLFLAFSNLADPASVRLLKPDQIGQVFGRDVTLRAIKLMVTSKPVTRTAVANLPWLANDDVVRRLPDQPRGAWSVMLTRLNKADFTRKD